MAKFNRTSLSLAVLSAKEQDDPALGLGILSAELNLSSELDGWAQLLPAGHFSAVDGRPFDVPGNQWFLDGAIAKELINQVRGLTNDRLIDYEHQTLKAEENGQPAIASGWFNADEMEWREGDGLYIKPRWTDNARNYIQAKEYRYLSAVFPYDKKTGVPVALRMAALVNYPGLDGLKEVSALKGAFESNSNQSGDDAMDEWLKDLLARLGIEVTEDKVSDEQGQAALSAVKGLKTKADKSDELTDEVAVLKANAKTGSVDLSQYVPKAMYDASVVEIASLKGESTENAIEQLIEKAFQEHRVFEREKDYLKDFGKQQGEAALKSMLESRAPIAALKGKQTDEIDDPNKGGDKDLTAEDLAVMKSIGCTKEEYLKARVSD